MPSLSELLRGVAPLALAGPATHAITGIAHDSRRVEPGALFVALAGRAHDGHAFLEQAYARGAAAAVGERAFVPPPGRSYARVADSRRALGRLSAAFYGHPTRALFAVGITGTKGKTSTAHFCAGLLGEALCLNTVTNAERGLLNTTPDALQVQRLSREALDAGHTSLVLEVSSHALRQARVEAVDVDVAVFTNLSQDHFDDFAGFEDYFEAKSLLFSALKATGTAVVNRDDPYGARLPALTKGHVLTYGLSAEADVYAADLALDRHSSRFQVHTPDGAFPLHTRFPARYNVYNLLAAVGVGLVRGLAPEEIKARLEALPPLAGRFELLRLPRGVDAVVDFAHSPDSLEQTLRFLQGHYPHVIAVFGCGGESDPHKRPLMGRLSGTLADWTVLTHDNPKHEDPQSILDQIASGLRAVTRAYEVIHERAEAIARALERAAPGDCVLIAGKGHERTQILGDEERPFNDRDLLIERFGATPLG